MALTISSLYPSSPIYATGSWPANTLWLLACMVSPGATQLFAGLYRFSEHPYPQCISECFTITGRILSCTIMSRHHRQDSHKRPADNSTQQNCLPFASVNSNEDPTPADIQHQVMYGVGSTSNDQAFALVSLHDAGLSQSDDSSPLPSDVSDPLPLLDRQIGQPNVHSVAGRPSRDGFFIQIPCLWTNHQSQCDFSADTIKSVLMHMTSQHLRKKQPSSSQVQCCICSPPRTVRRDTIRRHIREIHYGDKSRCRRPSCPRHPSSGNSHDLLQPHGQRYHIHHLRVLNQCEVTPILDCDFLHPRDTFYWHDSRHSHYPMLSHLRT
ncbi:uncharacterized protein BJ212DRAFT_1059350 [Suillus subaureus]|uniref:Uncharacterized protein n=1 Tax=Suillus subaureus TaxID=48587 RepID=A0A9P7JFP5_9AGAM|nr:uncharacterized protein BJ212DRAFT_1059350 [Suillus subaureus]KAG1819670.1 hypothetical protein BJ212DRAFT_1059350 [Suillus subaureus]